MAPFFRLHLMNTPLLCRVGLHQWFTDSAMFNSADCCNGCGKYRNQWEQDRLARERALWTEASERELSMNESMMYVIEHTRDT